MFTTDWKNRQTSSIIIIAASASVLFTAFLLYARVGDMVVTPQTLAIMNNMAKGLFLLLLITLIGIGFGLYRLYRSQQPSVPSTENANNTKKIILTALNGSKYFSIFKFSTMAYGIFYAFVTGLLVYRQTEVFSQIYNVAVPSWQIVPCCGTPGYVPILVAYITEHLGVLLIPVNLILLLVVSTLFGLNSALAAYAFDNRPRNANVSWFGGFGAVTGLFTGCPTCAGTFFASIFGLVTTASALALAPLQAVFIGVSIPLMLLTPILIARNIGKSIQGCSIEQDKL